jgi:rubredoxin---NAD+ reductase
MTHPVIIIGAGLAGWTTVREFRKIDTTTPVVVVTADSGDFYAKPTLSNAYAQKRTPEQLVSTPAAKMVETLGVTLLAHARVSTIDPAAKTITLTSGGNTQTLVYRQLVLATGAQPIRVPVQGNAADQVLSVNALDDFKVLYSRLSPGQSSADSSQNESKTIVIMGAGLIGCEFANDLVQAGHTVHIADPSERPLAALLPAGAGNQLAEALTGLGVQWHFGATVQSVDHLDGSRLPSAPALRVTLSDGTVVPADAVLSAIGLRADTQLAAAAGLVCERGIVVDAQLQTSAPQVFALGDCAQYASAGQRTLPYVMPIMNAAKALAATLNGAPTPLVFPLMPVSIKTPALPIVVCATHPAQHGQWMADDSAEPGLWRFLDSDNVQRGFVLTGKQTSRRMELSKATVL